MHITKRLILSIILVCITTFLVGCTLLPEPYTFDDAYDDFMQDNIGTRSLSGMQALPMGSYRDNITHLKVDLDMPDINAALNRSSYTQYRDDILKILVGNDSDDILYNYTGDIHIQIQGDEDNFMFDGSADVGVGLQIQGYKNQGFVRLVDLFLDIGSESFSEFGGIVDYIQEYLNNRYTFRYEDDIIQEYLSVVGGLMLQQKMLVLQQYIIDNQIFFPDGPIQTYDDTPAYKLVFDEEKVTGLVNMIPDTLLDLNMSVILTELGYILPIFDMMQDVSYIFDYAYLLVPEPHDTHLIVQYLLEDKYGSGSMLIQMGGGSIDINMLYGSEYDNIQLHLTIDDKGLFVSVGMYEDDLFEIDAYISAVPEFDNVGKGFDIDIRVDASAMDIEGSMSHDDASITMNVKTRESVVSGLDIEKPGEVVELGELIEDVFDLLFFGPVVMEDSSLHDDLIDPYIEQHKREFAQCLTDNDIIMYGTDRCPFCQSQKNIFGDAFEQVTYIDCDQSRMQCQNAGIQGFPTWITADGQQLQGKKSFNDLASVSPCIWFGDDSEEYDVDVNTQTSFDDDMGFVESDGLTNEDVELMQELLNALEIKTDIDQDGESAHTDNVDSHQILLELLMMREQRLQEMQD